MKANVQRLHEIATNPTRTILGLMSGTSIDGLDIALCVFHGSGLDSKPQVLKYSSVPYTTAEADYLRHFATSETVRVEDLAIANVWIARLHARMINDTLASWNIDPKDVDLIASHGQTIRHAPKRIHNQPDMPNATLQIGDGDHLAALTGILTISDFRQKHVALGGEGAPLAGYGDDLLFRSDTEPRILLNIGGIGNLTWLPTQRTNDILTFDTGPGNTLIDAYCRAHFDRRMDDGGAIASMGTVDETLLADWLRDPFFTASPPKTTGPELFRLDRFQSRIPSHLSKEDVLATLTAFTADSIALGISRFTQAGADAVMYVSGGGVHNQALMGRLASKIAPIRIERFESIGGNPDAKEALLFAALANELVAGDVLTMGKISF
jgi:anhydro-N-acetylmuramic acid kinase